MKRLIAFVAVLLSFNCAAQVYSQNDFRETVMPHFQSDKWYSLDTSSKKSFAVSIIDRHLQIMAYKPSAINEYVLANGKLLAINGGEWGGGLYYSPQDVSKKTFIVNGKTLRVYNQLDGYKKFIFREDSISDLIIGDYLLVAPGNTPAVVNYKNSFLFIQGFGYNGIYKGELNTLIIKKDTFCITGICDFDEFPAALSVFNNNIFVVTNNSFYSIVKGKKNLELCNVLWEGLYPTSIAVVDEKNIYVGTHGGYVKIDLPKKELNFLHLTNKPTCLYLTDVENVGKIVMLKS